MVSVVGGGGVEGKQGEQALMWGYFSKAVDLLVCVPGLVVCQVIRDIICKKLGNNFDSHLGFSAQMFLRRLLFSSAPPSPPWLFYNSVTSVQKHNVTALNTAGKPVFRMSAGSLLLSADFLSGLLDFRSGLLDFLFGLLDFLLGLLDFLFELLDSLFRLRSPGW